MSAMLQPEWRLVPMAAEHLRAVSILEREAYEFPWSEAIFADCLAAGYSAWVWQDSTDRVVGYALMTMAVGEAHLLNLCVDPGWRRVGLARGMLEHLLRIAQAGGTEILLLEVRVSNFAARHLYDAYGFREIGLRKGYYPSADGREDAIVLARTFGDGPSWPIPA